MHYSHEHTSSPSVDNVFGSGNMSLTVSVVVTIYIIYESSLFSYILFSVLVTTNLDLYCVVLC